MYIHCTIKNSLKEHKAFRISAYSLLRQNDPAAPLPTLFRPDRSRRVCQPPNWKRRALTFQNRYAARREDVPRRLRALRDLATMLEGAVARVLNQILGKYVQDLDTENLNVGIFSGLVQLTDLKLKTEALVSPTIEWGKLGFRLKIERNFVFYANGVIRWRWRCRLVM